MACEGLIAADLEDAAAAAPELEAAVVPLEPLEPLELCDPVWELCEVAEPPVEVAELAAEVEPTEWDTAPIVGSGTSPDTSHAPLVNAGQLGAVAEGL